MRTITNPHAIPVPDIADAVRALWLVEDLRHQAQRWEGRLAFLEDIRRGVDSVPSEAELLTALRAKNCRDRAAEIEAAIYQGNPAADCRCADPVCPKVHPVDMAVPA